MFRSISELEMKMIMAYHPLVVSFQINSPGTQSSGLDDRDLGDEEDGEDEGEDFSGDERERKHREKREDEESSDQGDYDEDRTESPTWDPCGSVCLHWQIGEGHISAASTLIEARHGF